MNRPLRIRMRGGVEAEGEKPSAIRFSGVVINSAFYKLALNFFLFTVTQIFL